MTIPWQPSASLSVLAQRAQFLQKIRQFFAQRGVMEVDTPVLCAGIGTDPALDPFTFEYQPGMTRFLQTSPEFAMKRLLAAGSGPIYYLGKAFRKGEIGRRHNPEFTMLEWYRPGWDHYQLIAEVECLFQHLFACEAAQINTYQELFEKYFDINPHLAQISDLKTVALRNNWLGPDFPVLDKDGWLDLLFTHGIEADLGIVRPQVVLDYPASQGALAKIRDNVAERFEFYYKGVELVNGYHELTCASEQRARFKTDLEIRENRDLRSLPIDDRLLTALSSGMPNCAGVAVGVDRLLMVKLGESEIKRVLPFAWEEA